MACCDSADLARPAEGVSGELNNQLLTPLCKAFPDREEHALQKLGCFALLCRCISRLVRPKCIYSTCAMERKHGNRRAYILSCCRGLLSGTQINWKQVHFLLVLYVRKQRFIEGGNLWDTNWKSDVVCLIFYIPSTCRLHYNSEWMKTYSREESEFKHYLNKNSLVRDGEAKVQWVREMR